MRVSASAADAAAAAVALRPASTRIELALEFLVLRVPPMLGGASERADGADKTGSTSAPSLMAANASVDAGVSEGCFEVEAVCC